MVPWAPPINLPWITRPSLKAIESLYADKGNIASSIAILIKKIRCCVFMGHPLSASLFVI